MESDITLLTFSYLMTRIAIVCVFGATVYYALRPTPASVRITERSPKPRGRADTVAEDRC